MKATPQLQKLFRNEIKADLVILNALVLDPFHVRFTKRDISIYQGYVVAFKALESDHVIDAKNQYMIPLLVDAHMHIESTTILPNQLEQILLPRGVGTLIADPHELANVAGLKGIEFILEASDDLDLQVKIMLPSSVPCTPEDHSGAILNAEDLKPLLAHPRVLGLAEVMDKHAVVYDEDMRLKLQYSHDAHKLIDGHGANLEENDEDIYLSMGISSDHECTVGEVASRRVEKGMMIHIRQGSVTKNLEALLPCITPYSCRRFCFCTDDMHPDDVFEHGGVDDVVRQAIQLGLDPALAYTMATYHPSTHYNLKDEGVIAPGYKANFFLLSDFTSFNVSEVYREGHRVAQNGQCVKPIQDTLVSSSLLNTIHLPKLTQLNFDCMIKSKYSRTILVESGNVVTKLSVEEITKDDHHRFISNPSKDLAKLSVLQRHVPNGQISHCPVKGFGLLHGAIASSVAHDSHNLVIASTNDHDALVAIKTLQEIGGGFVVVKDGQVLGCVPLEIAGLMTKKPLQESLNDWHELHEAYKLVASPIDFNPFVMLSFLALPVIPEVKLTDSGLVDVMTQKILPLEVNSLD
jgi:adenine deaminase